MTGYNTIHLVVFNALKQYAVNNRLVEPHVTPWEHDLEQPYSNVIVTIDHNIHRFSLKVDDDCLPAVEAFFTASFENIQL